MDTDEIPDDILEEADRVKKNLMPHKSRSQYEKEYQLFCEWRKEKRIFTVNEDVLLAYFSNKSKTLKSSSLWSKFSMLKSTLRAKDDIDIAKFFKLKAFLKRESVGYEAKKSLILTREHVNKFMVEAPDEMYLVIKIIMSFGLCGALRREELYNMSVHDIQDKNDVLIVTIPVTKTNRRRVFTVIDEIDGINPIELYRKYRALRPKHINHDKLFIYYKGNKCSVQRIGIHTIAKVPSQIAKYLNLPNAEQYTGHCFRRSSATMLADAGADLIRIKRHGGWKSSTVAEGYLEDSMENKKKCSKMILQGENNAVGTSNTPVVQTCSAATYNLENSASTSESSVSEITEANMSPLSNGGLIVKKPTNCTFNVYCSK